jgi:hypothetical protein
MPIRYARFLSILAPVAFAGTLLIGGTASAGPSSNSAQVSPMAGREGSLRPGALVLQVADEDTCYLNGTYYNIGDTACLLGWTIICVSVPFSQWNQVQPPTPC